MPITRSWQRDLDHAEAATAEQRVSAQPSTGCRLIVRIRHGDTTCLLPLPPGVQPKPAYQYRGKTWDLVEVVVQADTEPKVTA